MTNILSIEWIVACLAIRKIKGELAIFYDLNELYWSRERWFIIGKPVFFRYAVLIPIRAKRNNQNRILFLMSDNFSIKDWRSLLHILRIFI